jgi:membrane fusion protein (multidrug efflux system)
MKLARLRTRFPKTEGCLRLASFSIGFARLRRAGRLDRGRTYTLCDDSSRSRRPTLRVRPASTVELFASVALITTLGTCSCAKATEEEVESKTIVPVQTVAASRGNIRATIHATGEVVPAPGAELIVVAPEVARVAEVPHADGERVKRGDVLVRFEAPNLTADVQKQQAEATRAEAAVQTATAARTRAMQLFDRGVAARKEVEESTHTVAEAEAALAQARASLSAAQSFAGRAVVHATFDGVVAKRMHNPGDVVDATANDAVLRVIDPRRLEVLAAVPLSDSSRVMLGAHAQIAMAPTGETDVKLKVIARPASVDPGTSTMPVRLGFDRAGAIPAGTFVQVDIAAEQHKNVVLVPQVAIVRDGEETLVFVTDGKVAHRRAVKTGLSSGMQTEIVSGVNAGDMVIVDGQAGLPDEAMVTLVKKAENESDAKKAEGGSEP